MPHGKLTLVVEGATDIKDPGKGGSFCTLTCGSQVFSSPTVEGGGSHPFFNTAFEFEIDRTTNELIVCVYSRGSSRDDEMVGCCTLNFKKVFYHGHTVPLTAYPTQEPSGNPGGKINISFKFKMRLSPNAHNTHVPMRCSPPPRVTNKIVGRQSLPLDWGYDCHEEGASEAQNYRPTNKPHRHHENYLNLPGTASDNYQEGQPSCIRYDNPSKPRPQGPQTPNHARPSPRPRYNQPIRGKPQPQVVNKPQVQVQQVQQVQQVRHRPSVPVNLGGEVLNGLAEGVAGGLAEGVGGALANQFLGGAGEALLGAICNF